jgi:hypothetical protein
MLKRPMRFLIGKSNRLFVVGFLVFAAVGFLVNAGGFQRQRLMLKSLTR